MNRCILQAAMAESLPPFSLACPMKCGEVVRLLQMIAIHTEFAGIGVTVNADRKTLPLFQAEKIPKNCALVKLEIPRDIYMPYFFGELVAALNAKPQIAFHGDKDKRYNESKRFSDEENNEDP